MTTTMTTQRPSLPKNAVAGIYIETPEEMKFASETLVAQGVRPEKWGRRSLSGKTFEGYVYLTQDEEDRYFSETNFSAVQVVIGTVHAMSDAGLTGNENE